jgi:hypothetical protein
MSNKQRMRKKESSRSAEVCGDARGNNGPINPRRLEAHRGLDYVLRIGRVARLDGSRKQVLDKSMTGTTRRWDCRPLICWSSRKLAMDLGDSTNEADSCRMLVAKGAAPVATDAVGQLRAAKTTVPACSRAIEPLRGLAGTGTRVQEDEGRGSTRGWDADWCTRRDSGKPNHTFEAYHHAQRRLGAARDMDDPWLDVRPSSARRRPNGYNSLCYTDRERLIHLSIFKHD